MTTPEKLFVPIAAVNAQISGSMPTTEKSTATVEKHIHIRGM